MGSRIERVANWREGISRALPLFRNKDNRMVQVSEDFHAKIKSSSSKKEVGKEKLNNIRGGDV